MSIDYNFLGLVNQVCDRHNEIRLTSTNFADALGFYSYAKEGINAAIQMINNQEFVWPWSHIPEEETLVAGQNRYPLPSDYRYVDEESFRIKKDSSINATWQKLRFMSYEEYLQKYGDNDYKTATEGGPPRAVTISQGEDFIVFPMPDKAYTLEYEYWNWPAELENFDDVPTVPERFKHVILNGASAHAALFFDDYEFSDRMQSLFQQGMKNMRKTLINKNESARSTYLNYHPYRKYVVSRDEF